MSFPLAYLITFRTYGTWLHGDRRGSVDTHGWNTYGEPNKWADSDLVTEMMIRMKSEPFLLDGAMRRGVRLAIETVCSFRSYLLRALHVRTNHVHSVVTADLKPEQIAIAFKSNSTRVLRENRLVHPDQRVWSRGASTRYLWKTDHVEKAIDYVINGQGDALPEFLLPDNER